MRTDYSDITEYAGPPLWYDENGVPRYIDFHPIRCIMGAAQEAFLVEIKCQGCGKSFPVALTWQDNNRCVLIPPRDRLTKTGGKSLHYGPPPNIGCCTAGPGIGSDFHRIIEGWIRTAGPGNPWVKLDQDTIDAIGAQSEVGSWM